MLSGVRKRMQKDYFRHKAGDYDQSECRVDNVGRIADAIQSRVRFRPGMHILDFGSGTGLLLQRVAPLVERITAVDISPSMNAQLESKRAQLPCELDIREMDLTRETLDQQFDGIISSMTLHHLEDIPGLFARFHGLLNPGGFIALADLDREDGSFHEEDTGVFHFGFDRGWMEDTARQAGFEGVGMITASAISKPDREYPVFLLTATA